MILAHDPELEALYLPADRNAMYVLGGTQHQCFRAELPPDPDDPDSYGIALINVFEGATLVNLWWGASGNHRKGTGRAWSLRPRKRRRR